MHIYQPVVGMQHQHKFILCHMIIFLSKTYNIMRRMKGKNVCNNNDDNAFVIFFCIRYINAMHKNLHKYSKN